MNNTTNGNLFSNSSNSYRQTSTNTTGIIYAGGLPNHTISKTSHKKNHIANQGSSVNSLWQRISDWISGRDVAQEKRLEYIQNKKDDLSKKIPQEIKKTDAIPPNSNPWSSQIQFKRKLKKAAIEWNAGKDNELFELVKSHLEKKPHERQNLLREISSYISLKKLNEFKSLLNRNSKSKELEIKINQKRNVHQTAWDVVFSTDRPVFINTSIASNFARYKISFIGNEGLIFASSANCKRNAYLFSWLNNALEYMVNASNAISAQLISLPASIFCNIQLSTHNGSFHIVTPHYPSNTTLYHTAIKDQSLMIPEYEAFQRDGVYSRNYKVTGLSSNTSLIWALLGNTNDMYLLPSNQTQRFSGQGQQLNIWGDQAAILPMIDGTIRVFQYAPTLTAVDVPFGGTFSGINHISDQKIFICQDYATDGPFFTLLSTDNLGSQYFINTYNSITNTTTLGPLFGGGDSDNPPALVPLGPNLPNLYILVGECTNATTGFKDIKYDFVNASANSASIIGGEKTIYSSGSNYNTFPDVGVLADGTVILTYLNNLGRLTYTTMKLVDPTTNIPSTYPSVFSPSVEISTPVEIPSSIEIPPSILSPSVEVSSQVIVPTGSILIELPALIITPPNNEIISPITPNDFKFSAGVINATLVDKNNLTMVFTANGTDVPLGVYAPADFYNMSWSKGNAPTNTIPEIEVCAIIDSEKKCAKSVLEPSIATITRIDQNILVIVLPILGFVLIAAAITGVVVYKCYVVKNRNRRPGAKEKMQEMLKQARENTQRIEAKRNQEYQDKVKRGEANFI